LRVALAVTAKVSGSVVVTVTAGLAGLTAVACIDAQLKHGRGQNGSRRRKENLCGCPCREAGGDVDGAGAAGGSSSRRKIGSDEKPVAGLVARTMKVVRPAAGASSIVPSAAMIRLSGRVIAPVRTQERAPETLFSATTAKVAGAPT
jgi:hypothetical protein